MFLYFWFGHFGTCGRSLQCQSCRVKAAVWSFLSRASVRDWGRCEFGSRWCAAMACALGDSILSPPCQLKQHWATPGNNGSSVSSCIQKGVDSPVLRGSAPNETERYLTLWPWLKFANSECSFAFGCLPSVSHFIDTVRSTCDSGLR